MQSNIPVLDLHGEIRGSARILVDEFIRDNLKMGKNEIAIVHGIGEGILKKEVHDMLKKHRYVEEYHLDNFNSGCTIVKIHENLDKKGSSTYNNQQLKGGRD
ncbi:MAG: Smr/MutS family protein [Bacilli bacterium]|nr:Smr/MutS family protein [Bacilli bacterium]